jgi:hypothetical protein
MPRVAPCLSFFFACLWHIILWLHLIDYIWFDLKQDKPTCYQQGRLSHFPHLYDMPLSMGHWAGLLIDIVSLAMPSYLFCLLPPCLSLLRLPESSWCPHWYFAIGMITFTFISIMESLYSAPWRIYWTQDYKDVPVYGLTMLSAFSLLTPFVCVWPYPLSSIPIVLCLTPVLPVPAASNSFDQPPYMCP